CQQYNSLPCTC
nr:immunoglobulin light chain junction region [Macaca mulatta]